MFIIMSYKSDIMHAHELISALGLNYKVDMGNVMEHILNISVSFKDQFCNFSIVLHL